MSTNIEIIEYGPLEKVFRNVVGFMDYSVDIFGCIYSHKWKRVHLLSPRRSSGGKYNVWLCGGSGTEPKTTPIHIIVLEAFRGKRPENNVGRHLNDDSRNNCLYNLAWGTQSENRFDAFRNGKVDVKRGPDLPWSKVSEAHAMEIISSKESLTSISKRIGISYANAWAIRRGISWKHLKRDV